LRSQASSSSEHSSRPPQNAARPCVQYPVTCRPRRAHMAAATKHPQYFTLNVSALCACYTCIASALFTPRLSQCKPCTQHHATKLVRPVHLPVRLAPVNMPVSHNSQTHKTNKCDACMTDQQPTPGGLSTQQLYSTPAAFFSY
jgi:hypothetical protein